MEKDRQYVPKGLKLKVTAEVMAFLNVHNVWTSGEDHYYEVRQVYKNTEEENIIEAVDNNPYDRPVDIVMLELQFKWKYMQPIDHLGISQALFHKQKGFQTYALTYSANTKRMEIHLKVGQESISVYMGKIPTEQQFIHLENLLGLAGDSTGPDADQASAGEGVPQPQ